MTIQFKPFKTETRRGPQWFWRLVETGNAKIIATGGEGFVTRANAKRSIDNVEEEIFKNYIARKGFVVFRRTQLENLIGTEVLLDTLRDLEIGK